MSKEGRDKLHARQPQQKSSGRGSTSSSTPWAAEQEPNESIKSPIKEYKNTYKMEPEKPFNIKLVKEIITETLESSLKDEKYNFTKYRMFCQSISQKICDRVKSLGFSRYKIVCVVNVGEKRGQGLRIGSRCLWNTKYDKRVEGVYERADVYAVAVVYGAFYE